MNKDFERPDFDSDEQEILSLLKNIHPEEEPPVDPHASSESSVEEERAEEELSDTRWLLPLAETLPEPSEKPRKAARDTVPEEPQPEDPAPTPAAHAATLPPVDQLRQLLKRLLPMKGDPRPELIRKTALILSLAVFLCSIMMLLQYMVLEPRSVQNDGDRYADLYYDVSGNENHQTESDYPDGMQASFRRLYDINPDIAGWLSYRSTDGDQFMQIELPVVYGGDNETYLTRAFDGSKSRSGTLFFDAGTPISSEKRNKVNIIYGHNMASGLMFAPLNKLINHVYYARSAPTITMNTLYDSSQYQVFAVLVLDEDAADEHYFNYLRTSFASDEDFLNYVHRVRARSLYNYPVSVKANDEILVLSTCTNRSQVKVKNGRLAVFARRVSTGGNGNTDTTLIEKNEDVIMPYAWYTAQNLTPHPYYGGASDTGETTTATTATTAEATTTTEEASSGRTRSRATTTNTKTKKTGTGTEANVTETTGTGTAATETETTTPTDTATTPSATAAQEDPV